MTPEQAAKMISMFGRITWPAVAVHGSHDPALGPPPRAIVGLSSIDGRKSACNLRRQRRQQAAASQRLGCEVFRGRGRPLLLAVLSIRCSAAELANWGYVEASLYRAKRLEISAHSRVRAGVSDGFIDVRCGPVLYLHASDRVTGIAGAYETVAESQRAWMRTERPFAGVNWDALNHASFSLKSRTLVERFFNSAEQDFTRYRERLRLEWGSNWRPYASVEALADNHGLRSKRFGAGIKWSATAGLRIVLGYLYDQRAARVGGSSHVIVTSFHLGPFSRNEDITD